MGQKSNPISLRSSLKNTQWFSKYIEKTNKDSSLIIYQDLVIREYINRFFSVHGLILINCFINRYQNNLELILSYFTTSNSIKYITSKKKNIPKEKRKKNIKIIKKRNYIKIIKIKKIRSKYVLKKKKILNLINKKRDLVFFSKLMSSLNLFIGYKLNIKFIIQNVNKSLSFRLKNKEAFFYRKLINKLRFYSRSNFFSESINILLIFIKNLNMGKLVSEFIMINLSNLKKHNFFLTCIRRSLIILINSKYSLVKGLKLRINGRFNGAARSKTRMFKINKIPLQTLNKKIDFNQSISFTNNGTFGIKLWVFYK